MKQKSKKDSRREYFKKYVAVPANHECILEAKRKYAMKMRHPERYSETYAKGVTPKEKCDVCGILLGDEYASTINTKPVGNLCGRCIEKHYGKK